MITIIEGDKISYFDYTPKADKAIKNFASAKTVRIFKGKVFIQQISFHFFCELLRRETPVKLIYNLKG